MDARNTGVENLAAVKQFGAVTVCFVQQAELYIFRFVVTIVFIWKQYKVIIIIKSHKFVNMFIKAETKINQHVLTIASSLKIFLICVL